MRIAEWKDAIAGLGCLACGAPASLHHPREGQGMAQRADDALCVPLCRHHHQGKHGWHGDRAHFRMQHKALQTEGDMLAATMRHLLPRLELQAAPVREPAGIDYPALRGFLSSLQPSGDMEAAAIEQIRAVLGVCESLRVGA